MNNAQIHFEAPPETKSRSKLSQFVEITTSSSSTWDLAYKWNLQTKHEWQWLNPHLAQAEVDWLTSCSYGQTKPKQPKPLVVDFPSQDCLDIPQEHVIGIGPVGPPSLASSEGPPKSWPKFQPVDICREKRSMKVFFPLPIESRLSKIDISPAQMDYSNRPFMSHNITTSWTSSQPNRMVYFIYSRKLSIWFMDYSRNYMDSWILLLLSMYFYFTLHSPHNFYHISKHLYIFSSKKIAK